jgi:PAS domain-containing protein
MAKKDGAPFWAWVEATVAQDADGAPVWRVVVSDVTESKQTEQALRTAEALSESALPFRQLAESLPQLVWTCRADGLCDYLSPRWVEFTGVPEDEQLGLGWLKHLHPDDRAHAVISWNRAVDAGALFDGEFAFAATTASTTGSRAAPCPARRRRAGDQWFGTNADIEDEKSAETRHRSLRKCLIPVSNKRR